MSEQLPASDSLPEEVVRLRSEVARLQGANARLAATLASKSENLLQPAGSEMPPLLEVLAQHALLVITDAAGTMTYVNESFCALSGYEPQELLGQNASFIGSGYHSQAFWAHLWGQISSGKSWQGQIRNQAKDGHYFWVDMVITPRLDALGKPYQYVALRRDTTQQQQAEDRVRFHAYILSHIQAAVISLDNQYRITYWNQGAEKQYALPADAVLGKPLTDAFQTRWTDPEAEARALNQLAQTGLCRVEVIHQLQSGQELYVEAITEVLINQAGEKEGLLAVIHDVTGRVNAQQTLHDALTELKQRNEELDQYVYKVSHDLRAPLTSMLGLIPLIEQEADAKVKGHYLQLIDNRARKLDTYIQSVLAQSKVLKAPVQRSPVALEPLIRACFEELQYHPNWLKVQLLITHASQEPFYSDELRMSIIVKNLISNAVKYVNTYAAASYLAFQIAITPQQAHITVKDNGRGIAAEYLPRIFEMFFRATDLSDGAGLGLYIVKQAVEKLQGTLSVESILGEGTTFYFTFPNGSPDPS